MWVVLEHLNRRLHRHVAGQLHPVQHTDPRRLHRPGVDLLLERRLDQTPNGFPVLRRRIRLVLNEDFTGEKFWSRGEIESRFEMFYVQRGLPQEVTLFEQFAVQHRSKTSSGRDRNGRSKMTLRLF